MTAQFLKGMNVWSLPEGLTLEEQFQLVKEAGFDTIELNLAEENLQDTIVNSELALSEKADLTMDTNEAELAAIKKLSVQYELPISSISTSLHWTYPLNAAEEDRREKGKAIVKKMIDVCRDLGGDTILLVPGVVTETQGYDECYARSLEAIKELATYAEEQKITIGIENVWNKFLLSPLEFRQFIDEVNSPYVGAYFDVGNVLQYGFPEQWITVLGQRIAKIHVKDFKQSVGNIQGFTTLLQGDVDWKAVINALKTVGYRGPLTCELTPYTLYGEQLAFDSCQALSKIIK